MHLAHRSGGWPMQNLLWEYSRQGLLGFHELGPVETARMMFLMGQYSDTPMDLADAPLVATAERLGLTEIFTLDRYFHAYRLAGNRPLVVVP